MSEKLSDKLTDKQSSEYFRLLIQAYDDGKSFGDLSFMLVGMIHEIELKGEQNENFKD